MMSLMLLIPQINGLTSKRNLIDWISIYISLSDLINWGSSKDKTLRDLEKLEKLSITTQGDID